MFGNPDNDPNPFLRLRHRTTTKLEDLQQTWHVFNHERIKSMKVILAQG
jgi:hypothetical protein